MIIQVFEGCTSGGIDIDGKDFSEFSIQEQTEIVQQIFKFVHPQYLSEVLKSILDYASDDVDTDYDTSICDECDGSSTISTYKVPL